MIQTTTSLGIEPAPRSKALLSLVSYAFPSDQPASEPENNVNSSREAQTAISKIFLLIFCWLVSTVIGGRCRDVLKGRFYHPLLPEKVQEGLFSGTLIQHPALSGAMDGVPWARGVRSDDGCANNWQHHLSQSAEVHKQGIAPSITIGRMPNQGTFDEDKTHPAISSGAK